MTPYLIQALSGLSHAATLFLVASGLSIIFGVTRIVNFAHGAFYMLGAYMAYSFGQSLAAHFGGPLGFWGGIALAAVAVGVVGVLMEILLLRRIYHAPELFQLLATFGVVLIVQDAALWIWGRDDLFAGRAPGLKGTVEILGERFPQYHLFLILLGPVVLGMLWWLFHRTRWGVLVRAATQDREMVGALGVNQRWLFTTVVFLGSLLAGLGGALQIPKEAVNLQMDIHVIAEAFVVVVIGGMGSVTGAFLAALLVGLLSAFGILIFPQLTLVLTFLVMAVVLVIRPYGLLGEPEARLRVAAAVADAPIRTATPTVMAIAGIAVAALLALPLVAGEYAQLLSAEILIFALFAASLHFIMSIGGLVSFGHAAYFGIGAYACGMLMQRLALPMEANLLAAPVAAACIAALFGWFCIRLSGVYLAMLTLAFAQILWSVAFQSAWTGGDNGILGVWPAAWLGSKAAYYYFTLAFVVASLWFLRRAIFSPLGYALRAARDSPLRCDAIGVDVRRQQWAAFVLAGAFAGLAGALHAYHKGSVFPNVLSIPQSIDALVMVLLGGVQTLSGPIVGAAVYHTLLAEVMRSTEYWRAIVGAVIVLLVVLFPQGIVGFVQRFATGEDASARRAGRGRGATPLTPHSAPRMQSVEGGASPVTSRSSARPQNATPLLTVTNLSKSFGGVHAVCDVSFELRRGELLALIGPNGAGKSTCFNMLNGQLRPDRGSIGLDRVDITGKPPREVWKLGVGRTFQVAATYASMTVGENVQMALLSRARRTYALWPHAPAMHRDEAMWLLARVGMANQADRPCGLLAYGDVKRVELAMALAHDPKLLLMDEPTAGMAPKERNELMALTAELTRERNLGVLFTEHSMDVVFTYAQRILVLSRGRIIAQGDPVSVRDNAEVQAVYLGTGTTFQPRAALPT